MTDKSYPRLENGVVIYDPPASERPRQADADDAKPPSRGRRARRASSNEADED